MATINVSISTKIKEEGQKLVDSGYFSSFSDLIRTSLRNTIEKSQYDVWADEAKDDLKNGRAYILNDKEDIKKLIKSVKKTANV